MSLSKITKIIVPALAGHALGDVLQEISRPVTIVVYIVLGLYEFAKWLIALRLSVENCLTSPV